jgi:hypothetical protein
MLTTLSVVIATPTSGDQNQITTKKPFVSRVLVTRSETTNQSFVLWFYTVSLNEDKPSSDMTAFGRHRYSQTISIFPEADGGLLSLCLTILQRALREFKSK